MIDRLLTDCRPAGLLLVLAVMIGPAAAAAEDLPQASEIIARHVAAIGGAEQFLAHEFMTTHGTFAMPAMGLQGSLATWSQAPDRALMEMDIPGYGKVRTGYDGTVGWMIDPATGAQLLADEMLEQTRDEANFYAQIYRPQDFASFTVTGRAEFAATDCYELAVVSKNGQESQHFFAVESGLLVGVQRQGYTAMGKVPVTMVNKEYRDFDGLKVATVIEQSMMGMQSVMTIESVEFDPFDPEVFALPAEIAALAEAED